MPKILDLTGCRVGRLSVICQNGMLGTQRAWLCLCDCGEYTTVRSHCLRNGNTYSCGCYRREIRQQTADRNFKNMTGFANGRLKVTARASDRNGVGRAQWRCFCECGQIFVADGQELRRGHILSCGCLMRELASTRWYKHGHASKGQKSLTYGSWCAMHHRCYQSCSAGYDNYGGRGIIVEERWHSFADFYDDMGPRPPGMTLDREDSESNYGPGKCRWATKAQQNRNKRPKFHADEMWKAQIYLETGL